MELFLTIPIAFLPSLVWLFYYLSQDRHPEPKQMIVRTFVLGMAVAPMVALFQFGFIELSGYFVFNTFLVGIILILVNAFIEELFKYIVVWKKVIQTKFYDEPVDAVEYLIASALGFAAVENILIAFSYQKEFKDFLTVLAFRFLGATLIHAVSSATVGYFLARGSFLKSGRKRLRFRPLMIVPGLLLATVLHGLYNWFIIESQDLSNRAMLGWIAVLLVGSLLWVSWVLWKLNREGTRK